ncbi:MAG TPA: UDP-N-acetylmuramate--L-alanine ligase [Puia sp.]|jgi:UDP-N-acetylmuramate--alanine ligase|nr:UDP-N-acetylmuramate--L-alanine ligase [Puia sp.]
MIDIKNIQKIYFIGIGGIGMSALARYFRSRVRSVSGYDKTETALTKELAKEGIDIHYTDDVALIPKDAELVVYTPAVPKDHKELNFYRQHNYTVLKRSDVLGEITKSSFNICVAGTHGKTTITTMIAHILRDSGYGCNAFLGGIAVNYNSNFWSSEKNVCVVEADEYDRSFLKLNPDIAVITAMDADHLDIYGTEEAMQQAFVDFAGKVKRGGLLISKIGLKKEKEFKPSNYKTYSLNDTNADAHAKNIQIENGSYRFDVIMKDQSLANVLLNMGGMHNVENAVAAISVAHYLGIEDEKIKKAIASFKGVKRRFEYIIKNEREIFIDDYAHHPEELKALIQGAKGLFPSMKCTVIFQPHLFSRTRDLADGFAASLDFADEVILLPIYPARELPIEGVTSKMILDRMKIAEKKIMSKEELMNWIKDHRVELLITTGAGDIDALVMPIKEALEKRY